MNINPVYPADAAGIVEIYNYYILNTCVTYEYDALSPGEYAARIRDTSSAFPFLKAEQSGRIDGFAYAAPFHQRRAFDWDCEVSVYVRSGCTGSGIGRALYSALLPVIDRQGYINVYSLINHPNPASEALHREFGFHPTQLYERTGFKFGRWLDMMVMTRRRDAEPAPVDPDWRRIFFDLQNSR